MKSSITALLLAIALVALSHFFFGGGIIMKTMEVVGTATDPIAANEMAFGGKLPSITFVIALIINIVVYYIIAVVLILIFKPKEKPKEEKKQ
jgi:hypothetical protein